MSLWRAAAAKAGPLALAATAGSLGVTVAACADDNKYFDPEALERGAKALRDIQSSPYAKKVRAGLRGSCRLLPAAYRCRRRRC